HGSSLQRVVKCTVMLVDLPANYAPMNSVYRTYFAAERMPARSTFGASALALGARVEIECWATVGR
ncbi:MAG TPA: RidA family protein, partial [Pyrinomonadaceae bacterium]|nr:RidA family protein [Pyrinomonadaceae bacterium]